MKFQKITKMRDTKVTYYSQKGLCVTRIRETPVSRNRSRNNRGITDLSVTDRVFSPCKSLTRLLIYVFTSVLVPVYPPLIKTIKLTEKRKGGGSDNSGSTPLHKI